MNRYLKDMGALKPSRWWWGRPTGYISAPIQNGVGRYVCQLQRVSFFFCRSRNDSWGIRDFIESDLVDFARANPGVVVYLQPKRWVAPYVVAEYLNGRTSNLHASRLPKEEIAQWLHYLRCKSGQPIVEFLKSVDISLFEWLVMSINCVFCFQEQFHQASQYPGYLASFLP